MKRGYKILLIVAGCFFLAGLIATGIGFAAGGFKMFVPEPGVEKSYTAKTSAEDLKKIYVDTSNGDIHFKKSAGDQVIVGYYDYEKMKHTVTEENGVLQIIADDKEWYDYIIDLGVWISDPITVYVPESFDGEILADTSNGDMILEDLSLDLGIDCNTSNGKYELSNITAKSITLKTSNGQVHLENIKTKGDVQAKTSNGEMNAHTVDAKSFDFHTSNGKVALNDVTAPELLTIKSSNGTLEVFDIVSDNILLDTSVGDITGTISGKMGDYQIFCDDDGNLPKEKTTGSKKLEVDTSVGKIDIQFTED